MGVRITFEGESMAEVTRNKSTAHSKIGASSKDRWSQCPGSVRLSEGIPSISSAYAEEGTLAHSLAADWWVNGTRT